MEAHVPLRAAVPVMAMAAARRTVGDGTAQAAGTVIGVHAATRRLRVH